MCVVFFVVVIEWIVFDMFNDVMTKIECDVCEIINGLCEGRLLDLRFSFPFFPYLFYLVFFVILFLIFFSFT